MILQVFIVLLLCIGNHAFYKMSLLQYSKMRCRNVKMSKTPAPFCDALISTSKLARHRFFFPGHNGGKYAPPQWRSLEGPQSLLEYDLPELDELDNIHHPQSCLKESLLSTAALFKAFQSWYLINGSTGGIHIAIMTMRKLFLQKKNKLRKSSTSGLFLVPRDAHKAVFDGLRLSNSEALLLPCNRDDHFDTSLGIQSTLLLDTISSHAENIMGVVLTRPSYQGIMMTGPHFRALIDHCHSLGVPVLVDEAHGAHLVFYENDCYADALSCGADFSVQSSHKTLSSLSQTALLHLGKPDASRVVQDYHSMLTTTSPNALFLASLDAMQAHGHDSGPERLQQTMQRVQAFKERLADYGGKVEILDNESKCVKEKGLVVDPIRLSLQYHPAGNAADSTASPSLAMDSILCEEHGIYCELNLPRCITYIIPLGIDQEQLDVLADAIQSQYANTSSIALNSSMKPEKLEENHSDDTAGGDEEMRVSRLLAESSYESLPIVTRQVNEELIGAISAETIIPYPPGIPLLLRGEEIQATHLQALYHFHGMLPFEKDDYVLIGNTHPLLTFITVYEQ